MKVMLRRNTDGALLVYVTKKDLEEPVVAMERETLWGGIVTLANGWKFVLPEMEPDTSLPVTVEARRLGEG